MHTIRRRLAWTICGWLCCQLSVLAVTPVSLCAGAAPQTADAVECTCTHGPDAHCPMHHRQTKSPSGCDCNSSTPEGVTIVVSLFGPAAVLTPPFDCSTPLAARSIVTPPTVHLHSLAPAPDGPPPRA